MYSKFESEVVIRPDDIDMNNHVHNSRYLDYVLAARYEQMRRDYKMSMDEFVKRGFSWVVNECFIQFKRPLLLGDRIIIRTGVLEVGNTAAKVGFEIFKQENRKLASEGYFNYTLVNIKTGRAEKLPEDIIQMYSV